MKNTTGELKDQPNSSPHHQKLTVIDMDASDRKAVIFRRVSLKKYNTNRYIAQDPPKPVSRISIMHNDQ